MEEKLNFERFLFGDGNVIVIDDVEFCVDRIIKLPKIRPHQLEKAVGLSVDYCKLADFRRKILDKIYECPVLIYLLFKKGVYVFGDIEPFLRSDNSYILSFYFRKEIKDFESFIERKCKPEQFDKSYFQNSRDIDTLVENGYLPSSIEYCLKYDVIDDLVIFNSLNQTAKWSPFEWSEKPEYLDMLSFTGFFWLNQVFQAFVNERIRDQ